MVVAVSAIGFVTYLWATAEQPVKLDKATLCPIDGPLSLTVILLDSSDPLQPITKKEATKYLADLADAVPDYGLLEIRRLEPDSPAGRVIFSKCNPGDGSQLSEVSGNPRIAQKRWKEGFRGPLEHELEGSLAPSTAKTSPILETLQGIAVDRFTGSRAASLDKRLIIVSDLIEHEPGYSQYNQDLSYDRFRRSEVYKRFRTDLNGAKVSFLYVQRLSKRPLNSANHLRFWTEWVRDSNGIFIEAKKLQGAS